MALTPTNDPGVIADGGITFAMMDGPRRVSVHVGHETLVALADHDLDDERAIFAIFAAHRTTIERRAAERGDASSPITL